MGVEPVATGPTVPALAGSPFSPFSPVDHGRPPSRLDAVGLGEAAALYKALADARGLHPRQVDRLEVWECAVLLGVEAGGGRNLIAERIRWHREGGPMPEIDPTPPAVIAALPHT
jgi:hypothetical protein